MPKASLPKNELPYPGFYAPLYTQVPDELFDYWLPRLSEAELKVLLYIIRRTFGFKKSSDNISISQMVEGISTRDGRRLDYGSGVSEASVKRAVPELLRLGLIETQRNRSDEAQTQHCCHEPQSNKPSALLLIVLWACGCLDGHAWWPPQVKPETA